MYCRFFKNVSPLYLSDSKSQQMVHLLYVFSIHLSLSRLFDDGWCIVLNTFLYLLYNISTSNLKVSFQTARHFPNLIINPAMHNLYAYYTLNTTFWNSVVNLGNKIFPSRAFQICETWTHWIKPLVSRLSKICSPICGIPRLMIVSILKRVLLLAPNAQATLSTLPFVHE